MPQDRCASLVKVVCRGAGALDAEAALLETAWHRCVSYNVLLLLESSKKGRLCVMG